jgi:hypothetical protein
MKRIAFALAIAGLAGAAALAQSIIGPSSSTNLSPGSVDVTSPGSARTSNGSDGGSAIAAGGDGGTSGDGGTAAANNTVPGQPPMGPYSFEPPRIGLYSFTPR